MLLGMKADRCPFCGHRWPPGLENIACGECSRAAVSSNRLTRGQLQARIWHYAQRIPRIRQWHRRQMAYDRQRRLQHIYLAVTGRLDPFQSGR